MGPGHVEAHHLQVAAKLDQTFQRAAIGKDSVTAEAADIEVGEERRREGVQRRIAAADRPMLPCYSQRRLPIDRVASRPPLAVNAK